MYNCVQNDSANLQNFDIKTSVSKLKPRRWCLVLKSVLDLKCDDLPSQSQTITALIPAYILLRDRSTGRLYLTNFRNSTQLTVGRDPSTIHCTYSILCAVV